MILKLRAVETFLELVLFRELTNLWEFWKQAETLLFWCEDSPLLDSSVNHIGFRNSSFAVYYLLLKSETSNIFKDMFF